MEMLDAETWLAQQSAGTWADLFDRTSFVNSSQVITVLVWLLAFWLLGVLFMPLTSLVFRPLKDRGYGISKFFGLLIWGYFTWLCASLGMEYSRKTILLVLAVCALVNAAIAARRRRTLRGTIRELLPQIRTADIVFLVCFFAFLAVRWMNPDLWHPYKGGERPMDFSYFNAILKSTSFPPYDPWFAGGFLNYYYYGMYLSGLMVKLLGVIPSVAFNLNLALWYAFLGSAAFAIGKNLFYYAAEKAGKSPRMENPAGILTIVFMQVMGNLGTIVQIKNELIELGQSGSALQSRFAAFFAGIGKLIQGQKLLMYKGDWYWIPSRAIPDTSITEFPIFTFLYGDPHAHLFALPITVLVLLWLLCLVLRFSSEEGFRPSVEGGAVFFCGALLIGTLIPTNTWDMLTYVCIAAVIMLYFVLRYGFSGNPDGDLRKRLPAALALTAVFVLLTVALFLPYLLTNSRDNQIGYWDETHTPLSSYTMHWGVFLFFIGCWYALEVYRWMKYTSLRDCRLMLRQRKAFLLTGSGMAVLLLFAFHHLGVRISRIALPYMVLSLLLLMRRSAGEVKRFVFFIIGTALAASVMVEVVHLMGDYGRMNTVFKFYNQIWIMLSICAAFAAVNAAVMIREEELRGFFPGFFRTAGCVLVLGALQYPLFAGIDKMTDRMSDAAPHTLDGMKFMETSTYNQDGIPMNLAQDYNAILWMQENIQGSPVIVEGSPTEYKLGSRYTMYTGLPGVVGWNYHQRQQRGAISEEVWRRVTRIGEFYNTEDLMDAQQFLEDYHVKYIIVGQMEKGMYAAAGVAKFPAQDGVLWNCVYSQADTQIYEVIR